MTGLSGTYLPVSKRVMALSCKLQWKSTECCQQCRDIYWCISPHLRACLKQWPAHAPEDLFNIYLSCRIHSHNKANKMAHVQHERLSLELVGLLCNKDPNFVVMWKRPLCGFWLLVTVNRLLLPLCSDTLPNSMYSDCDKKQTQFPKLRRHFSNILQVNIAAALCIQMHKLKCVHTQFHTEPVCCLFFRIQVICVG